MAKIKSTSVHVLPTERGFVKRCLLLSHILVCFWMFNPAQAAEYEWELVYYDGAGGQLLGLNDFAYGGGVYVAVGLTNFASLNGKDWTPVASFRPDLSRVIYANGKFVAVGGAWVQLFDDQTGTNIIAISTNGFDWDTVLKRKIENGNDYLDLADVIFAQGKFFAVGNGTGKMLLTSEDAINWTVVTTDVLPYCNSIAYAQGRFVSVGMGVMTSTNGLDWNRIKSTDENQLFNLFSICYGGGLFTMCGGGSFYGIWESLDGSNWSLRATADGWTPLDSIAYGVGHRITVGSSAMCAREVSGAWTPCARPGSWETWGVRYANGYFYVVGRGNGIMRAPPDSRSFLTALPPGRPFQFDVQARPYCDYRIDYSEDFLSWDVLTNLTSFSKSLRVTDFTSFLHQRRFFRAIAE